MSRIVKVKEDIFLVAFNELKEFHKNGNDPLPEIGDMDKLRSALNYPFQSVFGKALFPGFYKKAACYFYGIAKGHIFINGNKRCGILAVNMFYVGNGKKCRVPEDIMYKLARTIANSKSDDKDKTIRYISFVLKKYNP